MIATLGVQGVKRKRKRRRRIMAMERSFMWVRTIRNTLNES
jgi:hypothetical protein